MRTYRGYILVSGVFCREGFCPGWFLSVPLLSEYIRSNIKLNRHYDQLYVYMYEKFCKSVTSHAYGPPSPVTNCHTFSDPLSPLECDVLYGQPLSIYTPRRTANGIV